MKKLLPLLAVLAVHAVAQTVTTPSPATIGEAEAQKVEDRIATVRRDLLSKYEAQLGELQVQFQKAADLESALAVRAERVRVQGEQVLSDKNVVPEPKSLRSLQQATVARLSELVSGVVADALPRLVEYKKQLTMEGKLDDALAVKQAIERLQNANVPITRADPGGIVAADVLLRAYSADRVRADKTYKGVRIVVRGVVAGYRVDPADGKNLHVYVSSAGTTGWVQCAFSLGQWRYREDRGPGGTILVLIPRDGTEARMIKGQQIDILGDCNGWDELVKLTKCDVPR